MLRRRHQIAPWHKAHVQLTSAIGHNGGRQTANSDAMGGPARKRDLLRLREVECPSNRWRREHGVRVGVRDLAEVQRDVLGQAILASGPAL